MNIEILFLTVVDGVSSGLNKATLELMELAACISEKGTINAERCIEVLEPYILPPRRLFQERPCTFQEDSARLCDAPKSTLSTFFLRHHFKIS